MSSAERLARQNGRVASQPDPDAEWWNTSDVARFLGVRVGTVSSYRLRGQMPSPDLSVGRTQLWRPGRIIEWQDTRPRPGVGGRPVGPTEPTHHAKPTAGDDTEWQVHGRRTLYDSPWVQLELADVELPNGERFE